MGKMEITIRKLGNPLAQMDSDPLGFDVYKNYNPTTKELTGHIATL